MNKRRIKLDEVILDIAAGPFGSNLKVECFVEKGFPIIDGANLKGFIVTDNITKFVTEEKARSLSRAIAKRGDVVVTISGTLGQIAYIPDDSAYEEYLCSQRQFRVTFDTEQVYVPFLVFYFHTREGQHKILSFANQTGVPALSQPLKNFRNIEIDLPDIVDQKKIAKSIETINEKIRVNECINENLLNQATTIYKSWFEQFSIFAGTQPDDWQITTLEEICSMISRGITPQYNEESDQIVINQKCIRNHMLDLQQARKHTPKIINEKWLQYGDLLINSTGEGTLGRTAQVNFIPHNMTVDSHITIVRPLNENFIFYIGMWGLTHEREIEALHTGSTGQTELPRDRLKSMSILKPDLTTLMRFQNATTPLMTMIVTNQRANDKLTSIRETLLPKLISGEIDASRISI